MRRPIISALLLFVVALAAGPGRAGAITKDTATDKSLLLATTTSVRDSGLLDQLLPVFLERTGIAVQVVAVGSGAALRMGREGNADVLLTHAEPGELALVASGAAVSRTPFMENHFVIAGPPEDPADVRGAGGPVDALSRIAAAGAPWVSRGDDSGTHRKEKLLFTLAGLGKAPRWEGFASTGSGMGLSLQVAGERRAYLLSDLGTFLAYRERTGLVRLSDEAPSLANVYSVLRIDPARFASVRGDAARAFEDFLTHLDTQRVIAGFGRERFGVPLFRPLLAEDAAPESRVPGAGSGSAP